jgi:hypothetical protein
MTDYHFFASTPTSWMVTDNLVELTARLKQVCKGDLELFKTVGYAIYRVPQNKDITYDIDFYAPQVKGTILLETGKAVKKGRSVVFQPQNLETGREGKE